MTGTTTATLDNSTAARRCSSRWSSTCLVSRRTRVRFLSPAQVRRTVPGPEGSRLTRRPGTRRVSGRGAGAQRCLANSVRGVRYPDCPRWGPEREEYPKGSKPSGRKQAVRTVPAPGTRSPIRQEAPVSETGQCGFESLRVYVRAASADKPAVKSARSVGAPARTALPRTTRLRWPSQV